MPQTRTGTSVEQMGPGPGHGSPTLQHRRGPLAILQTFPSTQLQPSEKQSQWQPSVHLRLFPEHADSEIQIMASTSTGPGTRTRGITA